ncbi:hypothetical protein AB5I41_30225 [Sphingomonas sp. MMS24-JH45]
MWQFHVLVEIANFAALRHLGRGRAELLSVDVADLLRDTIPGARVAVAGRSLIELDFTGASPAALDEALDVARAAFAEPSGSTANRTRWSCCSGRRSGERRPTTSGWRRRPRRWSRRGAAAGWSRMRWRSARGARAASSGIAARDRAGRAGPVLPAQDPRAPAGDRQRRGAGALAAS